MNNKELIRCALMGDKQAQEECAEKGIALPCPLCGDDVTITEIQVICREVDKDTGKIAVYPIEAEVTDTLIFKLGIRSRVNPELKYYAVTLCRWLQYGEEIKSILHSKNPTPKIRRYGGIVEI